MIQSNTIKKLLKVYDKAKINYESNCGTVFYKCLYNSLMCELEQYTNKNDVLKQYEISCKSYIDNDILGFNINVSSFLLSIIALLIALLKVQIEDPIFFVLSFLFLIVGIAMWSIYNSMKNRKISEILLVLNDIHNQLNQS